MFLHNKKNSSFSHYNSRPSSSMQKREVEQEPKPKSMNKKKFDNILKEMFNLDPESVGKEER